MTSRRRSNRTGKPTSRRSASVVTAAKTALAAICHTIRHAAVDELIAITWATAATVSTAHQVRRGASTSADTRSALGAQTRPIGAF